MGREARTSWSCSLPPRHHSEAEQLFRPNHSCCVSSRRGIIPSMSIQSSIEQKLATGLDVLHLQVINESGQHNVPAGSESHFKVVVVSNDFRGKSLVAQSVRTTSSSRRGPVTARSGWI